MPAEGDDHPDGILGGHHIGQVLSGEGLEVQPVVGVVVGGDSLGVAVHHDRLVAGGAQRLARMDAAIVELDALSDAVGARTADHHPRLARGPDLVGVLIGGIVVGRGRFELGRAGVDGLEGGQHAGGDAGLTDHAWSGAPKVGELAVGEAEPLGPTPPETAERFGRLGLEHGPLLRYPSHLVEEPAVHSRGGAESLDGESPTQQSLHLEDPLGGGNPRRGKQLGVAEAIARRLAPVGVEPETSLLQRSQALLERLAEGAAYGHDLSHRLHGGSQHAGRAVELLEGPSGDLGDHVVEGRLE